MEGNSFYCIILGRPWLKAYKAVASTYHQCVEAIWRNKQVVIEATKMPFDRVEFHFAEVALYQEYELEGENRILPFNPITLQMEEEDDCEVVELEKPPKIRRVTRPNGQVIYEFWLLMEGEEEDDEPNSLNPTQQLEEVHTTEEFVK